ncbi:hypothetical protein [Bradyrhizobium sp. CER78]|uniref:hypothetical protein n=1 Tax=Bradyrhizobium sp. CER78 TaxID=3039162 RepID=UPI00244AC26F|nr:hypothetical protein [Bradyrhizobium sp. CER78]MDH2386395.1 hypothetical protein [Bradyrhizobium sp. CER78]
MTLATPPRKFIATVGAPYIDESLRGYFGRALSVTAVRNVATMLKVADAIKPNAVSLATTLTDPDEIARIATLIGCTPLDIVSRTYRVGEISHSGSESIDFFGTQIRLHFRETKYRRVSPMALEIAQYHRAIWELRPLGYDFQTNEKLLSSCPACKRRLGWLRADVPTLCDKCDFDLRDCSQPVSPAEDEEAYGFVVGLVSPDPAMKEATRRLLPEAWRNFSNGDLFETAVALASGLTADPTKKGSAQGRSKRREQFEQLNPELLALAGRAIIGGAAGFADLCDRYRADMDKRPIHYGRRKELGPLAYITYDKHVDPNIRDLLRGLVDGNLEATSEKYALRRGKDAAESTMTIQTLSKTFGVRRSILQRLAESGLVPVVRADDAQSPVRMTIRDVRPLLAQMKDAIGENEAAGVLGLPLSVLPSLADYGLIQRLEGPVQGLVPANDGYRRSSVDQLMHKIWSAARPKPGKCYSIMVAVRSIGTGETHWAAVISAIIAGDAVVHDTGAQRRNIRFSLAVSDIDSFVAGVSKHLQDGLLGLKLPHWLAQSTAAELLQVNVAFFSRLANARPDLLPQLGPGYTHYLASDVQALVAKYIFVPEIARRADMHPRRVVSWLRSEHVAPSISLQENRDFGYPRSVVDPLLIALIDKIACMKASLAEEADGARTRFIAAVANGAGPKATAKIMGLPYRKAKRWFEVWRETGVVAARKFGTISKLDAEEGFLRQLVAEQPSIKLAEVHDALDKRGVKTSSSAVWNALERFDIRLGGRRRPT